MPGPAPHSEDGAANQMMRPGPLELTFKTREQAISKYAPSIRSDEVKVRGQRAMGVLS